MPSVAQQQVVILYEHALLGEGIARYLLTELGVEATVAPTDDLRAITLALATGPAVVIFEFSQALEEVDLTTLAPGAVLIDVSAVVTAGLVDSPDAAGLETIRRSVHGRGPNSGPR